MQSARTKAKILENLELLKRHLVEEYGRPVQDTTEMVLYSALSWTADDVESQMNQTHEPKL